MKKVLLLISILATTRVFAEEFTCTQVAKGIVEKFKSGPIESFKLLLVDSGNSVIVSGVFNSTELTKAQSSDLAYDFFNSVNGDIQIYLPKDFKVSKTAKLDGHTYNNISLKANYQCEKN